MWKKRATEEQVTGNLSRIVFKKSPELYGQSGSLCGKRVIAQDDIVTVSILIAPTAYMQDHLAAAGRIVVHNALLSKAISYEAQLLPLTVIALVKVDMQNLGVKYVQFMGGLVIVALFHTHNIEPLQNTFWKKKTGQHGVSLQFTICFHGAKVLLFYEICIVCVLYSAGVTR